jgi:hypothetical protein
MAAAATSADRIKVAALGARQGNCCCIGTSLDAQGSRGRVTAPGPDSLEPRSRVLRGPQRAMAPSTYAWSQITLQENRGRAWCREGQG